MGYPWLLILGLVLNVAHCLEILGDSGEGQLLEIGHNITGVVGEDVYLSCTYLGDREVTNAQWKRHTRSKVKIRKLVGILPGNRTFRYDRSFSFPVSYTNLTVKMRVTSVEVQGEYICEFGLNEEDISDSLFLTVVARPDTSVRVHAETINGTHYQSVTCSAAGGRPTPRIGWLVNGVSPSEDPTATETLHSNSTSTLSSVLRFTTLLLGEEDNVTCVIQHPTLPKPNIIPVSLETYARPNVTIKAEMVHRGGNEFWVVSCVSSGGRPATDISLALSTDEELEEESDNDTHSHTQTASFLLPVTTFEGRNVTCVFDHLKFTHKESRVITLPSLYLSGVQLSAWLGRDSDPVRAADFLELQEGFNDTVIRLEVTGNVPRYNISCKKDDGPLPGDVELVGTNLTIQGPVVHQHAGRYECVASYHRHRLTKQFNVTVKPLVLQPVPPTIRVDLRTEDGHSVIECSAADAVPAANMSWHLPEGVSGASWFNFTSHNGNHSVRGVLLLPACSPRELAAECVINHPAFEEPENRSVTLPLCARPNITIHSSTGWSDGDARTQVDCSVGSVAPAATITWRLGNGDADDGISPLTETQGQAGGLVLTRSSVRLLTSLYSGQNLTCVVEHPSLEAPEEKTTNIFTVHKAPLLNVSLLSLQDSPLMLAVCDCRGEGARAKLAWVLPGNKDDQTSLLSENEGHAPNARVTYRFPLALHEGQDLVCVYQCEHGFTEKRTIHIPGYYISVGVRNHTTPLESRYGDIPHIHRTTLKENRQNQRILLQVRGNIPKYNLSCQRSDGVFVKMEADAAVFQSEVTQQDAGLYTCRASFHHHTATVNIQVEVMSEEHLFALVVIICISSASAIVLVLVVTFCVFCKRTHETQYERKESLSALTGLMQQPGSPEVHKPAAEPDALLVSYAIVIDVKSTV